MSEDISPFVSQASCAIKMEPAPFSCQPTGTAREFDNAILIDVAALARGWLNATGRKTRLIHSTGLPSKELKTLSKDSSSAEGDEAHLELHLR